MSVLQSLSASMRAVSRRYEAGGWSSVADHLRARLRAQFFEHERHIVVVLDLSSPKEPTPRGGLRLEEAGVGDLPDLAAHNRERHDLTGDGRFAGDLADGYRCFLARSPEGEIVGFFWWIDQTAKPHREWSAVALGMHLGDGDVYVTDFYVAPSFRRTGAAAEFLYLIEMRLHELGYERSWGTVLRENHVARRLYVHRGYRNLWSVDGLRILRRWYFRMVPYAGD